MEGVKIEEENDKKETSESEESEESEDEILNRFPQYVSNEDWFELGIQYGLLKTQCKALIDKFYTRDFSSGVGVWKYHNYDLETSLNRMFKFVEEFGKYHQSVFEIEANKWCGLASLFFENRLTDLMINAVGDDSPLVDKSEEPYKPAERIRKSWFDSVESFELLFASRDALVQQCFLNSIEYNEEEMDFDRYTGRSIKFEVKHLHDRDYLKNYWRTVACWHLEDLAQFQAALAFQSAEESTDKL